MNKLKLHSQVGYYMQTHANMFRVQGRQQTEEFSFLRFWWFRSGFLVSFVISGRILCYLGNSGSDFCDFADSGWDFLWSWWFRLGCGWFRFVFFAMLVISCRSVGDVVASGLDFHRFWWFRIVLFLILAFRSGFQKIRVISVGIFCDFGDCV